MDKVGEGETFPGAEQGRRSAAGLARTSVRPRAWAQKEATDHVSKYYEVITHTNELLNKRGFSTYLDTRISKITREQFPIQNWQNPWHFAPERVGTFHPTCDSIPRPVDLLAHTPEL